MCAFRPTGRGSSPAGITVVGPAADPVCGVAGASTVHVQFDDGNKLDALVYWYRTAVCKRNSAGRAFVGTAVESCILSFCCTQFACSRDEKRNFECGTNDLTLIYSSTRVLCPPEKLCGPASGRLESWRRRRKASPSSTESSGTWKKRCDAYCMFLSNIFVAQLSAVFFAVSFRFSSENEKKKNSFSSACLR